MERRSVLKGLFCGLLGWFGFSKIETVQAEDLGVSSCWLSNGRESICFDVSNVEVVRRVISLDLKAEKFPENSISIYKLHSPVHGHIQVNNDKLNYVIKFSDYTIHGYTLKWSSMDQKIVLVLSPMELYDAPK